MRITIILHPANSEIPCNTFYSTQLGDTEAHCVPQCTVGGVCLVPMWKVPLFGHCWAFWSCLSKHPCQTLLSVTVRGDAWSGLTLRTCCIPSKAKLGKSGVVQGPPT